MNPQDTDLFGRKSVLKALKSLHNLYELEKHPLAALGIVEDQRRSASRVYKSTEHGLGLRSVLQEAIEELRVGPGEPDVSDKRWRPYIILKKEFVEEVSFDYLAEEELHISQRMYQYERGEAIDRLATILRQWEDERASYPVTDSWSHLVDLGKRQLTRTLESFRESGSGKYIASLYCSREAIEKEVLLFLESDKAGLVIVGEAGCGKTNLVCRLAEQFSDQGHLVLLYNCASLCRLEVDQEITQDLLLTDEIPFVEHVERTSQEALEAGRCFIVFLDAINEFQFEDSCRAGDLLHNVNSLVSRCSFPGIKFILTCRTPTWERLDIIGYTDLDWGCYYSHDGEKALTLDEFSTQEFERAYPLYQRNFDLQSDCASLSPVVAHRCQDPLFLRLTASAYGGRKIPFFSPSLTVFKEYYDRITRRTDQRFLELLAAEMWVEKSPFLSYDHMCEHERLGREVIEGQECAYERLRDLGFLMEVERGLDTFVQFTYERVFEYALSRHILKTHGAMDAPSATQLLDAVSCFPSIWGALQFVLLASEKKKDLLTQLSESADYLIRQFVLETLLLEHQGDPKEVIDWLMGMVEAKSELTRRLALTVAYYIGEDARDVFLKGTSSRDEDVRRTLANYVLLLWEQDPEVGMAISREQVEALDRKNLSKLPHIMDSLYQGGFLVLTNIWDRDLIRQISEMEPRAWKKLGLSKFLHTPQSMVIEKMLMAVLQQVVLRALRVGSGTTVASSSFASVEAALELPKEDRLRLERITPFLGPSQREVDEIKEDLKHLFGAQCALAVSTASVVMSTQLVCDFPQTSRFLLDMFEQLDERGRLSLFMSFANLNFPSTPGYSELACKLMKRLLEENPETFLGDLWGAGDYLDAPILAGIAACLQTGRLETHFWLIERAIDTGNTRLLKKCVANLATLGFFFPEQALAVLFQSLVDPLSRLVESEVTRTLAAIRTLHAEDVERALVRFQVPPDFVRRVHATSSPDLIQVCIDGISLWNSVVYYALYSAKLRRLAQDFILIIARAQSVEDIVQPTTKMIWQEFQKRSDMSLLKAMLGDEYFEIEQGNQKH